MSSELTEADEPVVPRIKIGTQRTGERLAPKPVPLYKPLSLPLSGETAEAAPTSTTSDVGEPVAESEPSPPPTRSLPQPKPTGKYYPPPNIRSRLSPDLEAEFAEAIGGVPIDDLLNHSGGAAVIDLEPETKVSGRVLVVQRDTVFVDLGSSRQGSLKLASFAQPPTAGALVEAVVSRFNQEEGFYELTLPGGAVEVGDWSQVAEGMIVEARVTGHNKGGLECEVNQLRGFIPAGQVSLYRVEDLATLVGEKFNCVVTEANPNKRNLVLSRRAVLEREKASAKESLLASLEVGQTREAVVRSLQPFGAFVDLGGVDGLVHISQLSWDRIQHASEVLELGQKIKVKIQKIDPETGKIGLGFRDLAENPWSKVAERYPVRSRVTGKVSRLMEFGAFVRLEPGVEGLVHISEISHKRVFRVSDVLSEGQEVEAQIVSVDTDQQRIGLSLKALEARPEPPKKDEAPEPEPLTPSAPPPRASNKPLKGGVTKPNGGEKFGLKW